MVIFPCQTCQTPLSAEEYQTGQMVRCPNCKSTLRVPASDQQVAAAAAQAKEDFGEIGRTVAEGVLAVGLAAQGGGKVVAPPFPGIGARPSGRRYGFNCKYCSSRLEATDSMSAQEGQCPTCGNNIVIPILDRYGRLIDPETREIIKQDPHPVHAYAAAGERAPIILRTPDDRQFIQCPRCQTMNLISANNCKNCGTPFTMDGTTLDSASSSNGLCVASLTLGIIGIPAGITILIPALAIVLGIAGMNRISNNGGRGRGLAIAGIVCGCIGGAIGLYALVRAWG
jgi:hypothetical protein